MVYALVDVGNSAIKAQIYKNNQRISAVTVGRSEQALHYFFKELAIERYLISSVVPSVNECILKMKPNGVLFLTHRHFKSLKINVKPILTVGIDRLVNAIAVQHMWNANALIIDIGTAVTFCRVKKNGHYLGGVIVPGFQMMQNALHQGAEQLPYVDFPWEPPPLLGQSTIEAMTAGLYYGSIGMINTIQREFKKKDAKIATILTGGVPPFLIEHINHDVYNPELQFEGLKIMHQKCESANEFK